MISGYDIEARLAARTEPVPFSGCLLWTGCTDGSGYGVIRAARKNLSTHRLAYEIANGPIPDGMVIRHTCDVRECCNPNHLLAGTHADNILDRDQRGRTSAGEAHPSSKLTEEQVLEIRADGGHTVQRVLSYRYGITQSTVSQILLRKKWRHV